MENLAERTLGKGADFQGHFDQIKSYPLKAENPQKTANIFSKWCFHYLQPVFRIGAKTAIQEKDVPMPMTSNRSKNTAPKLEEAWAKEIQKKNSSLLRALFLANWPILPKVVLLSLIGFGARNVMPFGKKICKEQF